MSTNGKVLRPGDARLSGLEPEPRRMAEPLTTKPTLTPEFERDYDRMSSYNVRFKYRTDPAFRSLVDQIIEKRGNGNVN